MCRRGKMLKLVSQRLETSFVFHKKQTYNAKNKFLTHKKSPGLLIFINQCSSLFLKNFLSYKKQKYAENMSCNKTMMRIFINS